MKIQINLPIHSLMRVFDVCMKLCILGYPQCAKTEESDQTVICIFTVCILQVHLLTLQYIFLFISLFYLLTKQSCIEAERVAPTDFRAQLFKTNNVVS